MLKMSGAPLVGELDPRRGDFDLCNVRKAREEYRAVAIFQATQTLHAQHAITRATRTPGTSEKISTWATVSFPLLQASRQREPRVLNPKPHFSTTNLTCTPPAHAHKHAGTYLALLLQTSALIRPHTPHTPSAIIHAHMSHVSPLPNLPVTTCSPSGGLRCDEALAWSPNDMGDENPIAVSGVSPPAQSKDVA